MSSTVLYTPDVLALTVGLVSYSLTDDFRMRGQARSKSCGSEIEIGLVCDAQGAIQKVGVRSKACAIGQASAALFAGAATGKTQQAIADAQQQLEHWLTGNGEQPDWSGITTIAAARDYPARHVAVLLPWRAALLAFENDHKKPILPKI